MKCLQKLFSSPLRLVAFSLLLSITFSTVLIKNNTYATSSCVQSFDSTFANDSNWYNFNQICNFHPVYVEIDISSSLGWPYDSTGSNGYGILSMFDLTSGGIIVNVSRVLEFNSLISHVSLELNDTLYTSSNYLGFMPAQIKSIFQNYNLELTYTFYDSVPSSGIVPSGSITLTDNGTYDVTNYSQAVVDVPSVPGDYHDDLQDVKKAIILVPAVCLVIYFFYAIYKMIMGGVRR